MDTPEAETAYRDRLGEQAAYWGITRAQALGIGAMPDTDALHVPERHRETVCKIIGEEMFKATGGVCCKVGEIRYVSPGAIRAVLPSFSVSLPETS